LALQLLRKQNNHIYENKKEVLLYFGYLVMEINGGIFQQIVVVIIIVCILNPVISM